jgi:Ca2+-transporting ATPase
LVGFIACFLGAAFFFILNGIPFGPIVILWINFLVQVPIALALGFDKYSTTLMERKPRPLAQPVLSKGQWLHIVFIGIYMAAVTLFLEWYYTSVSTDQAITIGFVVFSLLNIVVGLSLRSDRQSIFSHDLIPGLRQLGLFLLSLVLTLVGTFIIRTILGTTPLSGVQWGICIGFSLGLIGIEEAIKVFKRRSSPR